MMNLNEITAQILKGADLLPSQAEWLLNKAPKEALYEASHEIMRQKCPGRFELCSIANVKSGRCSEDCKWCAQSSRYETACEVYPLLEKQAILHQATQHEQQGVHRFSLVASGKRMTQADLEQLCHYYQELRTHRQMGLCASLGLLAEEDLKALFNAGVTRYHCNLETAPSYFGTLCSTHSQDDKIRTIRAAQKAGMDICSGGIIGMGESAAQRAELAFALKKLQVASVPLNLLHPIPGTPLEHQAPLSEEEVLTTIALFRFILPETRIRLAGGRSQLSRQTVIKALYAGANAAITGDLLTTTGSTTQEDITIIQESGFTI